MQFKRRFVFLGALIAAMVIPQLAGAMLPSTSDKPSEQYDVAQIQEYLTRYGYLANNDSFELGTFDERTKLALQLFQDFNGLEATGEINTETLEQFEQARFDDHPDVGEFATVGRSWPYTDLTYGLRPCSGYTGCDGTVYTPDLTNAEVEWAVAQALDLWASVTPLTFTQTSIISASNPDIIIEFMLDTFDGQFGVLARAWYPPTTGFPPSAISGDSQIDDAEIWTINLTNPPASSFDLVTVAAHEFGHSLGLGHSSVEGSIMAAFYGGAQRFLHADDVAGIQSLYGSNGGGNETHDVAVSNLNATSPVNSGDTVTVSATVSNNGTVSENVSVNLVVDGNSIDSTTLNNLPSGNNSAVNFFWTATTVGNHTIEINATIPDTDTNPGDNSQSTQVNVQSPPGDTHDVAVSNLNATSPVTEGDTVNVSATISNQGTVSENVTVSFTVDGNQVGSTTLNNLGSGNSSNVNLNWVSSGVGNHTIAVTASITTGDSDPGDNSQSTQVNVQPQSGGGGDMHVSAIDLASRSWGSGDLIRGNVYIHSNGQPVSGATVQATFTGPNNFSQTRTGRTNSSGYAVLWIVVSQAGTYTQTVDDVAKSGETYNPTQNVVTSASINTDGTPPPPPGDTHDVSVSGLSATSPVESGDTVNVSATINNLGTVSENVTVTFSVDGNVVDNATLNNLANGGSAPVNFTWTATTAGNHTITVNAAITTSDTNLGNNSQSTQVTVQEPPPPPGETHDVAVSNLNANSPVTEGDTVNVSATITNQGTVSENVTVTFTVDGNQVDSTTLNNLGSGSSSGVNFSWTSSGLGNHTIAVTASITTGDENPGDNNQSLQVTVQAPSNGGGDEMHVTAIDLASRSWGNGHLIRGNVYIEVDGQPVVGATVEATFTGPNGLSQTRTGRTNSSGYAVLWIIATPSGTYTQTVDDVIKDGETYNPAQNVVTSASLNVS